MSIKSFTAWLIRLNAIVFTAYGVAFVMAPESLSVWITGDFPRAPSGLIDMRSTYGGMSIGIGAVLGIMARDPGLHGLGLRAIFIIMSCMAGSRLVGIILDGSPNNVMWIYLALEISVAALAAWALRAGRAADG